MIFIKNAKNFPFLNFYLNPGENFLNLGTFLNYPGMLILFFFYLSIFLLNLIIKLKTYILYKKKIFHIKLILNSIPVHTFWVCMVSGSC